MYRIIEPEVVGGLGHKTQMDTSVFPPLVKELLFAFGSISLSVGDAVLNPFLTCLNCKPAV